MVLIITTIIIIIITNNKTKNKLNSKSELKPFIDFKLKLSPIIINNQQINKPANQQNKPTK